jgi:hypothetical protein
MCCFAGYSLSDDKHGRSPRAQSNLANVGYLGIGCTIPEAIIPHKRLTNQDTSPGQVQCDGILGHNGILVENFFERWKRLFRIVHKKLRGSRSLLKLSVPIAISLTNYHIKTIPKKRTSARVSNRKWRRRGTWWQSPDSSALDRRLGLKISNDNVPIHRHIHDV